MSIETEERLDQTDESAGEAGADDSSAVSSEETEDDAVLLRGPDLLTPEEGSRLAADGSTRLVVWAGERDSGKTTLSAEFYEGHRTGRASTIFAGSETLLGFEERIHPARLESDRLTPRTVRTESDPEARELLHLAVCCDAKIEHILFADIPGEHFRRMRDHELDASDVSLLAHADKLAVVVDGGLIADNGMRAAAVNFTRQLISQLKASDLPVQRMDVILLLTKLDLVLNADQATFAYWEKREEDLLNALRGFAPHAEVFRTAARGLSTPDSGMAALMEWILKPPPEPPEVEASSEEEVPLSRIQRIRAPRATP